MKIQIAETQAALGDAAARDIGKALRAKLLEQSKVRMIFAAAPSQSAMLVALRHEQGIEWERVTVFHMDEYLGLREGAPQSFGNWLTREFFDHVPLEQVHLIKPSTPPEEAIRDYAALLREAPIDLVLLGIGTNGHLAFNDPPADLNDPEPIRIVTLDPMCREQQVFDGCFSTIADVPKQAITLTVPTLLSGKELFCCVPGKHKSHAVRDMLESPVSGTCPATALRTHPLCTVYLDRESSCLSRGYGHG